jgi:hypothetical protein
MSDHTDDPKRFTKDGLELDASGNVKVKPVMGWTIGPVAGSAVLLAIQYADNPQSLERGGSQIPLVLTPEQCLELAKVLVKAATKLLHQQSDRHPN